MKHFLFFLFLISTLGFSQESIEVSFIEKTELDADQFIGVNNFEHVFYIKDNVLLENRLVGTVEYSNIQLGNITLVNTFNPLKINLFYKNFNTAVILDNRLAETFKIDFNTINDYKDVSHVSTGYDNTIWVFNQNNQQLELYDYKADNTRAKTLPINEIVLDLKSNYNYCWFLTQKYIYIYNYTGSLISKINNEGFTSIAQNNGNIFLKKENTLFYLEKDSIKFQAIKIPELLIKQFFVTTETLYIYDDEFLHQYQLIMN